MGGGELGGGGGPMPTPGKSYTFTGYVATPGLSIAQVNALISKRVGGYMIGGKKEQLAMPPAPPELVVYVMVPGGTNAYLDSLGWTAKEWTWPQQGGHIEPK